MLRIGFIRTVCVFLMLVFCGSSIASESLERRASKAFSRIGVGAEQAEMYSLEFEKFLKRRNSNVRRVLNKAFGEEVPVKARKAADRAARWSVKRMKKVLQEDKIPYYEEYLGLSNRVFLREAGLR